MSRAPGFPLFLFSSIAILSCAGARAADETSAASVWPREIKAGDATFSIHQPQVDRWREGRLEARAAVAVTRKREAQPFYGVVWLEAHTDVDRTPGLVALDSVRITKATFPWEKDGGRALLEEIRRSVFATATILLASLNASPAVVLSGKKATQSPPPKVPTPRVIHARGPAVLVLVDGDLVIKPIPGTSVLRVVNTKTLLLQDAASSRFYLPLMNRWLVAPAPNGKWTIAKKPPPGLEAVRKSAAEEPEVELLQKPGEDVKAVLRAGKVPTVFISTTPAVLASKTRTPVIPPVPTPARRESRTGDLYAGPDGNVYRPRPGGGWEKTNGRDWYPVQEPRGSSFGVGGPLEREREAREAGYAQRPEG